MISELKATLIKTKTKVPKDQNLIEALVKTAESHPQGVLVVIDELGKFLEASALEGGDDIYFFQELAEAASRTAGKLIIVGILHQSFDAYAARLGRQARDDWAKVQGRFVDIPLVSATNEVIELIGRAIESSQPTPRNEVEKHASIIGKSIRDRRPGTPTGIEASLARCWPLHPSTAALLGPISKRRFGQNERSTFGFLASREPQGFVEFLSGTPKNSDLMYELAQYWDYLRANLEPSILSSPDGHRWAVGVDAVERTESKGERLHIDIAKTVALLEMFRSGSGLAAEEAVIETSVSGSPKKIKQALIDLVSWKILIERKHLGSYGVFAGSDFDIEAAISQTRSEIGTPSLSQVTSLSNLQPVLAKRFYAETGAMHWLTRHIIKNSEIEKFFQNYTSESNSAGAFTLCIQDTRELDASTEKEIMKLGNKHHKANILIGIPKNSLRISELGLELASAERVVATRSELEGDAVARRELTARIASVKSALEDELSDAFSLATWYWRGAQLDTDPTTSLSSIASKIVEGIYKKSPKIFSELINRQNPSSNSNRARKDLMYQMIRGSQLENLGYDGFPADAGLYYTVLQSTGIHRYSYPQGWCFVEPNKGDRGSAMEPLWSATVNFLCSPGKSKLLSELYSLWAAAPYGVKAGVMPILALAFFMAHRSSLAMYISGLFTPDLSETVVDELLLDPREVRLQFVSASSDQQKLVSTLAGNLSNTLNISVHGEPLDVARALVGFVFGLPGWSKRTSTISQNAQDVRAMLLKANDPHKVLFADLPTLLQAADSRELASKLENVISELTNAYPNMLARVEKHLIAAIDHEGSLDLLKQRALSIKAISGDFRLEAFSSRLEVFDSSNESVEGLISLAASKPSANWVDRDIDSALVQLGNWAHEFRKVETLAPLSGRTSSRRMIGVVFGASKGLDVSDSVDISDSDTPAVENLVKKILSSAQKEKRDVVIAALAEAGALLINQKMKEELNG
ncbi:MAG TPA: ATP-binding protein [Methylotenera sp.]